MANKKVSQLVSKPSVLVTDLFPIADPTTGQLYKTTISDLGTAIGSGVSSVNTLVGAVVLDTDDIQELASPTNRWFTDTRARAALSASSPLAYNSGTGVFSIPAATSSQNGYLTSTDWTTFNGKQAALSGTGFVKISGTTISYDNSTYLTTSAAASTYLALAGGTLTGALNGTSANFSGDLTLTGTNPRFYLTDSDNNPDYFISNTDGTFTVYDVTNSTSRFTIGTTGNGTFGGNLTVGQIIRSGGTSSQFLKADGSVDSTAYVSGSGATGYYARFTGSRVISDGFIQTTSNITYVEGMGLSTLNGLDITGNYGAGGGGLKIRSYDETTGNAYIDFANTGGRFYLGLNRSTASGLMTNATAYATVLTTGLGTTNLEFGTNATKRLTLDGTTGAATFTSSVTASSLYVSGMTAGSGALYYNSGANRVTVANYNASGIVTFEVGGGATALTLNSNTSATFASTLSATIGSFSNYISVGGTSGLNSYGTINIPTGEKMILNSYHGLELKTSGGVGSATPISVFNISSAGAATFSSDVTLGGNENYLYFSSTYSVGSNTRAKIRTVGAGGGSGYGGDLRFSTRTPSNTWNEDAMIIDSSGKVGIGTTAPSAGLEVITNGTTTNAIRIATNVAFNASPEVAIVSRYKFNSAGDYTIGSIINTAKDNTTDGSQSGNLQFFTNNGTTFVERMRITSSGNVGIGTTSPGRKLQINVTPISGEDDGINVYNGTTNFLFTRTASTYTYRGVAPLSGMIYCENNITLLSDGGNITFNNSGSERMRITSGGNVLINKTSSSGGSLRVLDFAGNSYSSGADSGYFWENRSNSANYYGWYATSGTIYLFNGSANAASINPSTGVYTALSDKNKKKDFEVSNIGLNEVMKLKPTLYRMKSDESEGQKELGFIAQDVKSVIPNAYVETEDFIGLNFNPIVAALTKAVQELKTELDTLKNK
jgi:hypothetical protein